MSDIFTLFTASDIRQTRDRFKPNLETFILVLTERLFYLFNHSEFPHPEIAPAKELLNCIRLLTRILPFIYEQKHQSPELDAWFDAFFWGRRRVKKHTDGQNNDTTAQSEPSPSTENENVFDEDEFDNQSSEFYDTKPLGEQLIDTALNLLFCGGITVPKSTNKVAYSIWETGVGCTTPLNSTGEQDSNKIEILRFLLALVSDCLYTSPSALPIEGSKFLTYMVTKTNKRMAMAILCSLLNTSLKYSPRWKVPYDHMLLSDGHKVLITYSLQFLEALLIYPIPESSQYTDGTAPKNIFRHLCSKIHKAEDLQFIADSLVKMLSQPIHASSSYLPGSRQEIPWTMELTMLFWDLVQCNKKFKHFLIATERMHDFLILLLYYIHERSLDNSKLNLVRLCAYELLYLTGDPTFASSLSKTFTGQSMLPSAIQLSSFVGSYSDYLIIRLIKTITNKNSSFNFLIPTFLECIYNIAPYTLNIGYQAAASLVQLCAATANPSFLFANETNHKHLETVLKSINLLIECNFSSNINIAFLILKNDNVFYTIKSLTVETDIENIWSSVSRKSVDAKISSSYAELEPYTNFVIDDENGDNDVIDDRKDPEKLLSRQTEELSIENEEKKRNPELSMVSSESDPKNKGKGFSSHRISEDIIPFEKPTSNKSFRGSPYDNNGTFSPTRDWAETWLPLLPIYTIMTVISHLKKNVPYFRDQQQGAQQTLSSKLDASKAIDSISRVTSVPGVIFYGTVNNPSRLPSDFDASRFVWNRGSLGWYESILWGAVFQAECEVTHIDGSNMIIHTNNCMPVGVWNHTNIKLFRLQGTAPRGPSLLRPKGAVDAVADTMMQKIGQLRQSKN